ncbi:CDP-glucose 4,6-dehydratase [Chlorobium phaeovibrioides]|uniref:CDP-glucose 4,6-dehydratase n=1 Tax=Chlorobium phaeovibrioides TaxID=1094 RepID=UPI001C8C6058|nr:CDP-glucose 4,6-dehydratase [Chlorobium phaeovibrioides]
MVTLQQYSASKNFWLAKKVLITGHTGFKGSWLALWLNMLGAEVAGYALEPLTPHDNFVLTGLAKKINHRIGDVRNYDRLQEFFRDVNPEIVFHLAAQPLVRESYNAPKETFDINVGGTVNLLECCRQTESVKVIVNVTTDKCYENKEWVWGYRENDRLGGYDPYSSSKACSELVTEGYRKSFFNHDTHAIHGKSLASARAGNVFGGGDWQADRIVPDCIRALEQNEPIIVRSPHAVRPWQHVLEPLSGYLLLAQKMAENPTLYSEAWNFGPEESSFLPVGSLVDRMVKTWGEGSWEDHSKPGALHEANLLKLDISKAKSQLGWSPLWNIDKAITETVSWFRQYRTSDMHDLCCRQINDYMKHSTQHAKHD